MKNFLMTAAIVSLAVLSLTSCQAPQSAFPTVDQTAYDQEQIKQYQLLFKRRQEQDTRIFKVGMRIFAAATPFCPDNLVYSDGIKVRNLSKMAEWEKGALAELYKTTPAAWPEKGYVVTALGSNFPAEQVLKLGDVLTALNGKALDDGEALKQAAEENKGNKSVEFTVLRNHKPHKVTVITKKICDYNIMLLQDSAINANADSKTVRVTTGILEQVAINDTQLATILGHEAAHNAMGHIQAGRANRGMGMAAGALLDILASSRGVNTGGRFANYGQTAGGIVYGQDFEREADYVGLYIMARAGYDIHGAPDVWREMALAGGGSSIRASIARSHPSSPERFLALEQTVKEIDAKRSKGRPLIPEMKKRETSSLETPAD